MGKDKEETIKRKRKQELENAMEILVAKNMVIETIAHISHIKLET